MSPQDKISDKIKKLLKLANGNTTEGEATAAMQKVQELLADYNLTMAQVEAANTDSTKTAEAPDSKRTKEQHDKSALYKYQRNLMRTIAECNFCIYWTGENKVWRKSRYVTTYYHVLIGREANVVSARLLFDYLNSTIEKLATAIYPSPTNLSKSAICWKEGCAARLCERLLERKWAADKEQQEKAQQAQSTTALVLLSDVRTNERDLNYDFMCNQAPGTTARRRAESEALRRAEQEANPVAEPEDNPESEADRKKREKANEKFWERWQKKQDKEHASKDWDAYHAGHNKGADIGLDTQIQKGA